MIEIVFIWCGRLASENVKALASGTTDALRVGEC
jgi:hypothetical protein